jgi:putative oligomerization/nucleic acid binding protein
VWAGMMVWMLGFWILVIVLAFGLAAWLFPGAAPVAPRSTARDILDSRYARGELTQEQYWRMRQEVAPEPRRPAAHFNLIVVLILAALVLVTVVGGFGMHGGWPASGYPSQPGEWPTWMPHMWGR